MFDLLSSALALLVGAALSAYPQDPVKNEGAPKQPSIAKQKAQAAEKEAKASLLRLKHVKAGIETIRHTGLLTKEEIAVVKALGTPLAVDWDKVPLKDVITDLRSKSGLDINVHEESLKAVKIDLAKEMIILKADRTSVREVLRTVLRKRGLDYIVKNGNLHVVSAQEAGAAMMTRVLPITEFIGPPPVPGPRNRNYEEMVAKQTGKLVKQVMEGMDRDAYKNGAGVTYDIPTMCLVIRAPTEMHLQMGFGTKFCAKEIE